MSDLIDRQAAIDAVCEVCGNDCDKTEFKYNCPQDEQVILCPEHYELSVLPSVQPECPKGYWIIDGHHVQCSVCFESMCNTDREGDKIPTNFCPNCGADMRGEQE